MGLIPAIIFAVVVAVILIIAVDKLMGALGGDARLGLVLQALILVVLAWWIGNQAGLF